MQNLSPPIVNVSVQFKTFSVSAETIFARSIASQMSHALDEPKARSHVELQSGIGA